MKAHRPSEPWVQSKYFPNLLASSDPGFHSSSSSLQQASPCDLQPHPSTLLPCKSFPPSKAVTLDENFSCWETPPWLSVLFQSQRQAEFCCPSHKIKTHCCHSLLFNIYESKEHKKQKPFPSCPHDKNLATRSEVWFQGNVGVSHCCETICRHKLCAVSPYQTTSTFTQALNTLQLQQPSQPARTHLHEHLFGGTHLHHGSLTISLFICYHILLVLFQFIITEC